MVEEKSSSRPCYVGLLSSCLSSLLFNIYMKSLGEFIIIFIPLYISHYISLPMLDKLCYSGTSSLPGDWKDLEREKLNLSKMEWLWIFSPLEIGELTSLSLCNTPPDWSGTQFEVPLVLMSSDGNVILFLSLFLSVVVSCLESCEIGENINPEN